jgi:hypothetical protein
LAFGHVEFGVTASIIVGSVPAVLIGSLLSSRAPDRYIRPAITFVIFVSGLKYVGVGTDVLGWIMGAVLVTAGGYWLVRTRIIRPNEPGLPAPGHRVPAEPLETAAGAKRAADGRSSQYGGRW